MRCSHARSLSTGCILWVNTNPRPFAADTRGAFVQPALYEAFGLTVIEAMTCGLPCFATNRGGPAEIIKNGLSGYHIECAPLTALKRTVVETGVFQLEGWCHAPSCHRLGYHSVVAKAFARVQQVGEWGKGALPGMLKDAKVSRTLARFLHCARAPGSCQ